MINDENKYKDLINTLKNLQQVKAAPNFEADLKRKMNEEKYGKEKKESFKDFLIPSRVVPAFGLVVIAVIIIFSININSDDSDNPFLMEPRLRKDIVSISNTNDNLTEGKLNREKKAVEENKDKDKKQLEKRSESKTKKESFDENLIAGREFSALETTITDAEDTDLTNEATSPPATGFAIRKSGLNFRQVNPTVMEQKEIQQLKEKVQKESKPLELK